jgi:hypothetical protein
MKYRTGLFKTRVHSSLYTLLHYGGHTRESASGPSRWKRWQKRGLPLGYKEPTKDQTLILPEEYLT